jgi:AraC-like DNA-binding protein
VDQSAKRYLDRHRIVRTRNMDAAQEFLHSKGFELDISSRDAVDLDVCINCAILPNLSIGYLQNGIPATIRSLSSKTDYQVTLPIQDAMEAHAAGQSVPCGPLRAVVSSSQSEYWARSVGGGRRFRVCITEQAVREQLGAMLGYAPMGHLEFAPGMDLTKGFGRKFARYILAAVDDFERTSSIMGSPLTVAAFEQFIVGELLLYHPHNYSNALSRLDRSIAPRDVKRAIDYIHANLESPLTISRIATTAGVPGQTLFKHFRDAHGISPMRYVRNLRFERARKELMDARPGARVTEIASHWGFSHLGRFAVEYRLRFGESPSETLGQRDLIRSEAGKRGVATSPNF